MDKKEIGDQLLQAREEKSIPLSQIAEETRISQEYLAKLEQGVFTFLPKPYVLAYIKTYAKYVGLESDALVEAWLKSEAPTIVTEEELNLEGDYQEEVRKLDEKAERYENSGKDDRTFSGIRSLKSTHLKELAIGLGVIIVLLIIILIFSFASDSSSSNEPSPSDSASEPTLDDIIAEQRAELDSVLTQTTSRNPAQEQTQPQTTVPKPSKTQSGAFSIGLSADGRVWLEVSLDGGEAKEYLLQPKESVRWLVQNRIEIKTGNAGATLLTRDGQNLSVPGDSGQVRRIHVTRDSLRVY